MPSRKMKTGLFDLGGGATLQWAVLLLSILLLTLCLMLLFNSAL